MDQSDARSKRQNAASLTGKCLRRPPPELRDRARINSRRSPSHGKTFPRGGQLLHLRVNALAVRRYARVAIDHASHQVDAERTANRVGRAAQRVERDGGNRPPDFLAGR
jgi:hypothetical protein